MFFEKKRSEEKPGKKYLRRTKEKWVDGGGFRLDAKLDCSKRIERKGVKPDKQTTKGNKCNRREGGLKGITVFWGGWRSALPRDRSKV